MLTARDIERACKAVVRNYGRPDKLIVSPRTFWDLDPGAAQRPLRHLDEPYLNDPTTL